MNAMIVNVGEMFSIPNMVAFAAFLTAGFAMLKPLLSFGAGVLITVFRPFKTGDYVKCAGDYGLVENVRFFTTRLRTPKNRVFFCSNVRLIRYNVFGRAYGV